MDRVSTLATPLQTLGGVGGTTMSSNSSGSAASVLASSGVQPSTSSMANYKIISTIGRGNFGVCHLCECIDGRSPANLGKLFVIKQINMSQLSASEKDGAVQEVKLLSELHHPFIVGYRESFLEGEVLNIVMNYCLAEKDHQLLTNKGFLFLGEVERIMHGYSDDTRKECDSLRFAAYNPLTKEIEYLPATALIINAPGAQMVEFTSSSAEGVWTDATPSLPEALKSSNDPTSNISLLVTADHDMYVRRVKHAQDHSSTDAFSKQKAGSLLPSRIQPEPQHFQFLAHAEAGFQSSSSSSALLAFLTPFSITSPPQIDAFLELYGLWLSEQSESIVDSIVCFDSLCLVKQTAIENCLHILGCTPGREYSISSSMVSSGLSRCTISARWASLFLSNTPLFPASPAQSSVQPWCFSLSQAHVQRLLVGMLSVCSPSSTTSSILIHSSQLRDDLVRLALHAGVACSPKSSGDGWLVSFASSAALDLTQPILSASTPGPHPNSPSSPSKDRTWCVTVPPYGLVITRRALLDPISHEITHTSQPVIIGNCEGGDLTTLIKQQDGKPFSEEQILDWFIQLCLSLRYIHQRRIIHRDLKSQNVFLTKKKNIRLGDFGIARVLNGTNELAMSVVGTPYSMSPEVCENKPYSFASDIWSLGCVLYELCTLKHAFDAHNLLGLVWKIVSESYPPIPSHYSPELTDLVSKMLAKQPENRPSIDAILELPFIRARLHSQIRAKMNLRTSKPGTSAGSAGKQGSGVGQKHGHHSSHSQGNAPLASPPAGGPQQQQKPRVVPGSTTVPISSGNNSGAAPPSQSGLGSRTASEPGRQGSITGGSGGGAGPTGTMRQRPSLNVASSPPTGGNVETLLSPAASQQGNGRASSAMPAHRAPAPSTLQSPSAGGQSMLSPTDRLAAKKQAEADARARELENAVRNRAGLAGRPTPGARPGSSLPTAGPYASAFGGAGGNDQFYDDGRGDVPRQRSAGPSRPTDPRDRPIETAFTRDGSYSGRGGGGGANPPLSPSPTQLHSSQAQSFNEDRPIKSSGSYRLAGTALSPAAMQQARTGSGSGSVGTPPSGTGSSSRSLVRDETADQESYTVQRPNSVSSSRVTRVRDEDDGDLGGEGDDSYSSDEFEPLSDEEEEIFHELERTLTIGQPGSSASRMPSLSERPTSSTVQHASQSQPSVGGRSNSVGSRLTQPSSSPPPFPQTGGYMHAGGASNPARGDSYPQSSAAHNPLGSPLGTHNSVAPTMSSKHALIKEKCLRSMSEAEFNEVYTFIKKRSLEALNAKDGSKDLTKDELANKFGVKNQEIVFLVEQLVFLSGILDKNTAQSQEAKKSQTIPSSSSSTASKIATTPTKAPMAQTPKASPTKPTSAGSATSSRLKK